MSSCTRDIRKKQKEKKKREEEENRMVMVILFNMRKICMMKLPDCKAQWSKERLLPSFTVE